MRVFFLSRMILIALAVSIVFFSLPLSVDAAGLIPCGSSGESPCTLCHIVIGVQGIIKWGFGVMTFIAVAIIAAMGVVYIVSAGDTGMIDLAKRGIKMALAGFALMLSGWLIVNVVMYTIAKQNLGISQAENWYTFKCDATSKTGTGGQIPPGPGGNLTCENGACAKDAAIISAVQSQSYMPPNDYMAILQAGEHYGQTSTCKKGTSPSGACGYSQVMPATAQGVCGLTCAQIVADVNKDIACGAKAAADFKRYHNTKCVDDSSKRIDCTIDGLKSLAGCYNRGFHCNLDPRNVSGKWYDCGEKQGGKSYCDRVADYAAACNK